MTPSRLCAAHFSPRRIARPASAPPIARRVRLVDEINRVDGIVVESARAMDRAPSTTRRCRVRTTAAAVLEQAARLLEVTGGDCAQLHAALAELARRARRCRAERARRACTASDRGAGAHRPRTRSARFVTSLDPSFRAQELGFTVSRSGRRRLRRRRATRPGSQRAARPPAGGPRRHVRHGAARARARRSQLGLAAQQPARSARGSRWLCSWPTRPARSTPSGSFWERCRCCARTRSARART